MNSLSKEEPAAVATSSSSGAGEASTSGNAATVKPNASAGTAKYAAETDASESDDDALVDELDDIVKRAIIPKRDFQFDMVIGEYNKAIATYERLPKKIIYQRDHRYDVYMAGLDNVINQQIERTNPGAERVAYIKLVMQRFYHVLQIWMAHELQQ